LIVWTDKSLASLDPANGRIFWRELMNTSNNDDVAAPVFWGNRLLVSGLMLELGGDPPAAKFLWPENRVPSKRILSNTSTPAAQGEYIYSCRSPGDLVCLEAATGRQIWSTNSVTTTKNGASIHITPQGDGFFLFTDEGNLIRARLSPAGYREISRSHLIDPTWPLMENNLFTHLRRLRTGMCSPGTRPKSFALRWRSDRLPLRILVHRSAANRIGRRPG
jgi:hypothetical protein